MKKIYLFRGLVMTMMLVMASVTANAETALAPYGQFSNQIWNAKYFYALIGEGSAPDGWYAEDFDDSEWGSIEGPISLSEQWSSYPALSFFGTVWAANNASYWVRRHFNVTKLDNDCYKLFVIHDDKCTVYLNGVQIYNGTNALTYPNYNTVLLSGDALAALKEGDNILAVYVTDSGGGQALMDFGLYGYDFDDVVTRSDVPFAFTNSANRPWLLEGTTVTVRGDNKTNYNTSWLTNTYYSDKRTEVSFEWASYNWSSHSAMQLYIDGTNKSSTSNSSFTSQRYYLPAGEHTIAFRDSIGSNSSSNNWSSVRNMKIKEILPLETAVLTENSQPLTFENNSECPWMIEDGYVEHGNWCKQRVGASFSTTFTVDQTSKLSFKYKVGNYNYDNSYNYENSHNLFVTINGVQISKSWNNVNDTYWCVMLEPGEYTVVWKDTVYTDYADWINYYSQIKDIELTSNWQTVELATAGTLGYEVLSLPAYDVLTDVEMLKIIGPMNASDWTDIKNMTNLKALDLSEAVISTIPNNAFDGKGWINSVILPEGISSIGEYSFRGTNIRRIKIPSTVTTIAQYAFNGTPIQYVSFADNSQCTIIANDAFYNCGSLQSIDWGENPVLKTIGYGAFKNCSSLKEMVLPSTVTSVESAAFQYCSSIKKMHFSDAVTDIAVCVCDGLTSLTDLHLPVNATIIRFASFNNTPKLRHIDLPSTLNDIYYRAFDGCGVDSVILPINLQNLSEEAFRYCNNLKYIEMPSYLNTRTYSYHYHVYDAGNTYYTTTGNMGYYGNFYNCPAIEKVVMRSATPPSISRDAFDASRVKSAITLVVPSFSVVNYKLDTYWYQFGSIIEGDDVDYWKLTSPLMLTNNRRMQGTPDVDLYYGGQLTVGGSAPFTMGTFNMFINESNPGRLLNTCDAMSAEVATTKFSVSANTWYFFTPLHDVNVADINVSNNASYVFRYYDAQNRATNGASGSWKNVDTDKLLAGQGYIFHCNTACVITFPADVDGQAQIFRTTDVTKTLTVNESATTANRSWNYVGNPYPCYYDIYYMDFTAPITVWTGSTYKAYSVADDEFVLRPMQSFFVQKPDAVDEIIFHKEGRQLTTSINHVAGARGQNVPAMKTRSIFNLQIEGENGMIDETRVVLNDAASESYELGCDAAKFMSFDASVPQLLTTDDEGNCYAINERPQSNGLVTLAYYAGVAGTYTISALRADGTVLLIDNETGLCVNLAEESYTFNSEATEGMNGSRFVLQLGESATPTLVDSLKTNNEKPAAVFDLTGRRVNGKMLRGIYIQNGRKVVK